MLTALLFAVSLFLAKWRTAGTPGARPRALPHRPVRVLLGLTGSVASIKAPLLVPLLKEQISLALQLGASRGDPQGPQTTSSGPQASLVEVRVIATRPALHFVDMAKMDAASVRVLTDEDEWKGWSKIGDSVLHIDLRSWADIYVVAPLDANTLAKFSCGLSDNLITCVFRAWDFSAKPLVVCPAMNTFMWSHPHTAKHLQTLCELGIDVIPPIAKVLACGDVGVGAMADIYTIAHRVADLVLTLDLRSIDLANLRATGKA